MHRSRTIRRLALALVVSAGLAAPAATASSGGRLAPSDLPGREWKAPPAADVDAGAEQEFVNLTNQARAANGKPALVVNGQLTALARTWSQKMAAAGALSHNQNLPNQAPAGWQRVGENVGQGPTVGSIQTALMNSASHRANILGAYNQVGIGVERVGSTFWVTEVFMQGPLPSAPAPPPPAPTPTAAPTVCSASNPPPAPVRDGSTGYYVLGGDGGIFAYGNAVFAGSLPGLGIRADSKLLQVTPSQGGYWVLGGDGGIFSFGDARFFGSVPGLRLAGTVAAIDLKPTNTGNGYWILTADGGIFSFGDARFFGSLPGVGVRTRAVKIIPTPSGNGYWILGEDGGIFSFGDARFFGSLPGSGVRNTSISLAATPTGHGYWVLGRDGGIFAYGDARFFGSVPGTCSSATGIQMVRSVAGAGYYVLSDRGRVFAFGDAPHLGEPAHLNIATRDIATVRR